MTYTLPVVIFGSLATKPLKSLRGLGDRGSFFRLVTYLLPMVGRWIIVWNIVWKKRLLENRTKWRPFLQPLENWTPVENRTDPCHWNSRRFRDSSPYCSGNLYSNNRMSAIWMVILFSNTIRLPDYKSDIHSKSRPSVLPYLGIYHEFGYFWHHLATKTFF